MAKRSNTKQVETTNVETEVFEPSMLISQGDEVEREPIDEKFEPWFQEQLKNSATNGYPNEPGAGEPINTKESNDDEVEPDDDDDDLVDGIDTEDDEPLSDDDEGEPSENVTKVATPNEVQMSVEEIEKLGLQTTSAIIRHLWGLGYTRSAIAKRLGKRYQHVNNVINTPLKRK